MKLVITDILGTVYEIDNSKIKASSYKANTSDDNELLLGYVSASSFNCSILDVSGIYNDVGFKGALLDLYTNDKSKKIGRFKIEEAKRKKDIINISSVDKMVDLDKKFAGAVYPLTVYNLLQAICLQVDIDLKNINFTNYDLIVNANTNIKGKSCREVLQYICEVAGSYAIIDPNGKLELKWYDLDTVSKNITYSDLKEWERTEIDAQITGVSVYIGDEKLLKGTTGYDLYLTADNPVLTNLSSNDIDVALTNIYNKVKNMVYMAAEIKITNDYTINVGDTIRIVDNKNIEYKCISTSITINNDYSINISSAGENRSRDYDANKSNGTNTGGGDSNTKTFIIKEENLRDILIRPEETKTSNNISIFDVTEATECFMAFSLQYFSHNQDQIKIEVLINDLLASTYYQQCIPGFNVCSISNKLNLIDGTSTVTLKITTIAATLNIDAFNSVITLIANNCTVQQNGRITEINENEKVKAIILTNILNLNLLTIVEVLDTVTAEYRTELITVISEIFGEYNIKIGTTYTVDDITQNITIT